MGWALALLRCLSYHHLIFLALFRVEHPLVGLEEYTKDCYGAGIGVLSTGRYPFFIEIYGARMDTHIETKITLNINLFYASMVVMMRPFSGVVVFSSYKLPYSLRVCYQADFIPSPKLRRSIFVKGHVSP